MTSVVQLQHLHCVVSVFLLPFFFFVFFIFIFLALFCPGAGGALAEPLTGQLRLNGVAEWGSQAGLPQKVGQVPRGAEGAGTVLARRTPSPHPGVKWGMGRFWIILHSRGAPEEIERRLIGHGLLRKYISVPRLLAQVTCAYRQCEPCTQGFRSLPGRTCKSTRDFA